MANATTLSGPLDKHLEAVTESAISALPKGGWASETRMPSSVPPHDEANAHTPATRIPTSNGRETRTPETSASAAESASSLATQRLTWESLKPGEENNDDAKSSQGEAFHQAHSHVSGGDTNVKVFDDDPPAVNPLSEKPQTPSSEIMNTSIATANISQSQTPSNRSSKLPEVDEVHQIGTVGKINAERSRLETLPLAQQTGIPEIRGASQQDSKPQAFPDIEQTASEAPADTDGGIAEGRSSPSTFLGSPEIAGDTREEAREESLISNNMNETPKQNFRRRLQELKEIQDAEIKAMEEKEISKKIEKFQAQSASMPKHSMQSAQVQATSDGSHNGHMQGLQRLSAQPQLKWTAYAPPMYEPGTYMGWKPMYSTEMPSDPQAVGETPAERAAIAAATAAAAAKAAAEAAAEAQRGRSDHSEAQHGYW